MSQQIEQEYMIRDPSGSPSKHTRKGFPVSIPLLPEWQFFICRGPYNTWELTETRSGSKFPSSRAKTQESAVKDFISFCDRQGREECLRVFNEVIDKWGDLTRPQ